MAGRQTELGKAFEYACVKALYEMYSGVEDVEVEDSVPFVRLEVITMRLVRRKKILMMVHGPRCGFLISLSRACGMGMRMRLLCCPSNQMRRVSLVM